MAHFKSPFYIPFKVHVFYKMEQKSSWIWFIDCVKEVQRFNLHIKWGGTQRNWFFKQNAKIIGTKI